jgi:hypothetical protein
MSDEQRKEEEAEVEAHRRRHFANDEPSEEAEGENDFEAHRFRKDRPKKD